MNMHITTDYPMAASTWLISCVTEGDDVMVWNMVIYLSSLALSPSSLSLLNANTHKLQH